MTCKDCIHEKVCDSLIKSGCPWLEVEYPADKFCMYFKNKADVVEVVRCKDCRIAEMCEYRIIDEMKDNDFCSYGEKK